MPDTSLLKPYNATCGGGLVLNKDVYDMAPGEALQLVNFEPSTEGGYRRLNGTTKYNSTIVPQVSASSERIQMSAIFNDKIIAARGGTVSRGDTSGSWTSLATSKGTTNTYDFDKFNFNGTSKIIIATGEAAAFTVDSSFNVDVINATGSGVIGGFTLTSTEISASGLLLKSSGQITASAAKISGDITITGVVGGSNAFSNFTVYNPRSNNNSNFTYSGGGSISNLTQLNIFNPGPSIDTINTIVKAQDKEIAFFDSPVFKLFNSLVTPTITDLLDTGITGSDGTDIQVDFLDGDTLIIDKSLQVASNEFDSLETNFAVLFDDSLLEDSSDVSINSTGIELFKTSSLNSINEKSNLDELLISFTKNEDLYQGKSFIF